MGYLYENSDDERFQQLCQSLFLLEFPNLQCFPVGQPDAGRDGLDPDTNTVLQVKFKKADDPENADWLISSLKREKSKIDRLIAGGLKHYIIATNAQGTGHGETGRIDLVQKWLNENISIPAQAMWRDDIDRRLDNAAVTLKLKYTEILSLEDGLPIVLDQLWSPDQERQKNAIRGFVAKQYKDDAKVKFKQVELNNKLLDLFVDVPIGLSARTLEKLQRPANHASEGILKFLQTFSPAIVVRQSGGGALLCRDETNFDGRSRRSIGAAEFFLGQSKSSAITRAIIEGAPGQGKSTIAQFVCQVHRARYLNDVETIENIAEAHLRSALRIPIKVDLRDFASYLDHKSPFGEPSSTSPGARSLELFLAVFIQAKSGGIDFSANDVVMLCKQSPMLLFLDGLDEVADIDLRQRVISTIGDCLARFEEFGADVQVVVTSRPATFGKVPKLDKLGFDTLILQQLDSQRIAAYAERWTKAGDLEPSEKDTVKTILKEKLALPHIKSLTTNAMQLAILLSLIHQVGHSLPDQRTDLYRRYIELFLTREADKSVSVREHRPLLIGFILHLAWVLQREAESSKSAGSVSVESIKSMARDFLERSGNSTALADDLFSGGLERVFVLVERIEGLYEFEVQPLREFFCAQHLYSTAPGGTYRDEPQHGDRAQRFEALAANPFWMNVARFYAGFYETGGIGALVVSIQEMATSHDRCMSAHVRRVGLALLQDWVFSTKKFAQDAVIKAIFDDFGLPLLAGEGGVQYDNLALDAQCGQATLRSALFERLASAALNGPEDIYSSPIRLNGGQELAAEFCEVIENLSGADRTGWLRRMFRSGAARNLSDNSIADLISQDGAPRSEMAERRAMLLSLDYPTGQRCATLVDDYIRDVLDGIAPALHIPFYPLGRFSDVLVKPASTDEYYGGLKGGYYDWYGIESEWEPDSKVTKFLSTIPDQPIREPHGWSDVADSVCQIFGPCWAATAIAINIAGIRDAWNPDATPATLFDESVRLCDRARLARMRRGGPRWWLSQLTEASNQLDRMFWVSLVLMWSSPDNLQSLSAEVNEIVEDLSEDEFVAVRRTLSGTSFQRQQRADRAKLSGFSLKAFSERAGLLAATALQGTSLSLELSKQQLRNDAVKNLLGYRSAIDSISDFPSWSNFDGAVEWLRKLSEVQRMGYLLPRAAIMHIYGAKLDPERATKILEHADAYPVEVLQPSIRSLERHHKPVPLATVASQQAWTFE